MITLTQANQRRYKCMQQVFSLHLKKEPSIELIEAYFETDSDALQQFCMANLKDKIAWSTGIGIIDAAVGIYDEAVGNDNFYENWP